jgi:hypothetical protein
MAIEYTNFSNFKALQKLPKFGFLVCTHTIWQPWATYAVDQRLLYSASYFGPTTYLTRYIVNILELPPSPKKLKRVGLLFNLGPMLWYLKYFRRIIHRKNLRFWLKTKLNFEQKLIIILLFKKNAIFSLKIGENRRKLLS